MRQLPALGLAAALAFAACSGDGGGDDDGRVTVVASFYPLAEAAAQVGGEAVAVVNLTPAGIEPHDLELSTDEVDRLLDADLVVYLGGGFQPAVDDVVGQRDGPSIDVSEALGLEAGADPHFWLDPTLLANAVDAIAAGLAAEEPEDADGFTARAARYRDDLAALDAEFAAGLTGCARTVIVTAHAAFGFLTQRYGLTQSPIAGFGPESEPDPNRIAELTDLIHSLGITTVFAETLVNDDVADALAREAGVATAVLNPIEGLTDAAIDAGDNYLSVMRANLATLREALTCP